MRNAASWPVNVNCPVDAVKILSWLKSAANAVTVYVVCSAVMRRVAMSPAALPEIVSDIDVARKL